MDEDIFMAFIIVLDAGPDEKLVTLRDEIHAAFNKMLGIDE